MIMMGLKFMGDVPFRDVYLHALIRDMKGQKMSKSKGNVVDPLPLVDRYGTDAFRFTLAAFAAQGRDIKFSEDRVEGYRHFVNKLWNAARFIMMSMQTADTKISAADQEITGFNLSGRWILSRLAVTSDNVNKALDEYRFNDAASDIYQFIWHEFCDWYIEMAKPDLKNPEIQKDVIECLLYTLDVSLRLLHPFMPFVTEEIWQKIPHIRRDNEKVEESIMISRFPSSLPRDYQAEEEMSYIIDAVTGIRTIRGELNILPSSEPYVSIKTYNGKVDEILKENVLYIKKLAHAGEIRIGKEVKKTEGSATCVKGSMEIYVLLKGVLNVEAEMGRLGKAKADVEESLSFFNKKLMNEDFLLRAPKEVVEKEKAKYEELSIRKERIMESIKKLREVGGEK
jgi:valyl-tRNA synthetase